MKNNQILIIAFIFLIFSGFLTSCFSEYLRDKSDQVDTYIDNTGNLTATSDISTGNEDAQNETTSSENVSGDTGTDLGSGSGYEENTTGTHIGQKFAVIASGSSYDSQHYTWFLNSTNMAYRLLKNSGYTDENIYYLFENSKEAEVDFQSTIDNFKKVTGKLQEKSGKTDTIVLFLIGHGSFDGTNSYYALSGYNLSDTEMAAMFKNLKRDKLIFVFSPCNSGGFVDDLSGENTVVITSTRKDETNSAAFIEPFLISFDGIGDADFDGKVSFAEAFNYASLNVRDQYINNNWGTLTEHAQLDDNGDAVSNEGHVPIGGDGHLAETIYLNQDAAVSVN